MKVKISRKQLQWIDSRARNLSDVFVDHKGLYVYMGDGLGGEVKVYVPKDRGGIRKKGKTMV
jgi:hypothetical protein